jgi:hypothetical protein
MCMFSFLSPTSGGETNELKVTKLLLLRIRLLLRPLILSKRHGWDKGLFSIHRRVGLDFERVNIC